MAHLKLREVNGILVHESQVKAFEKLAVETNRAFDRWLPKLKSWQKAIQGKPVTSTAFQRFESEIRQIDDPQITMVAECFLPNCTERFGAKMVELIGRFKNHQATLSLARISIGKDSRVIKSEALRHLKERPIHEFVPYYLNSLNDVIHSVWQVAPGDQVSVLDHVVYDHVLFRNGKAQIDVDHAKVAFRVFTKDEIRRGGRDPRAINFIGGNSLDVFSKRMANRAAKKEQAVSQYNESIREMNAPIFEALEKTTDKILVRDSQSWRDWWDTYNELHVTRKPVNKNQTIKRHFVVTGMSCFAAGTLVWTETGLRAIDFVRVGDRVLSQDPDTGELDFKVVVEKTLRPPTTVLDLDIEGEHIRATKGHPFWVNNHGWRMAKLVKEGDNLHSVSGALIVDNVAEEKLRVSTHNLVVADFGTYFVGKRGVLVHDNSYRKPTTAIVPGLHRESVVSDD